MEEEEEELEEEQAALVGSATLVPPQAGRGDARSHAVDLEGEGRLPCRGAFGRE